MMKKILFIITLLSTFTLQANAQDLKSILSGIAQQVVGDKATTLSRLSPMGKIQVGEKIYEAKSLDSYVDPRVEVEVVGFENFTVIVKKCK